MWINLRLREIMESRVIKQTYICEKTGLSPDAVSRIMNGTRKVTGEELLMFCDLFDVDPRSLRQPA